MGNIEELEAAAPGAHPGEPRQSHRCLRVGVGGTRAGSQGAADPYPRRPQSPGSPSAPTPRRRLGELRGSARMPGPKPGLPRSVSPRRRRRAPAPCLRPARSPLRLTDTGSGESLVARRPRRPGCSGLGGGVAPREPTRRRGAGGGAAPRGQPGGRPGRRRPGPRACRSPPPASRASAAPAPGGGVRGATSLPPHPPRGPSGAPRAPLLRARLGGAAPRVGKGASEAWRELPPPRAHLRARTEAMIYGDEWGTGC
ncbi:translation initiation factor IF-2 [Bubalus bubalis]|uniref:translation initiation factor IF-2 n=1 Tax=Bubalus bubalis TaxID=89462 RepID=UPI001E1B6EAA|nr:translation initiation factor IF-2 [Bubalus bubalis]